MLKNSSELFKLYKISHTLKLWDISIKSSELYELYKISYTEQTEVTAQTEQIEMTKLTEMTEKTEVIVLNEIWKSICNSLTYGQTQIWF